MVDVGSVLVRMGFFGMGVGVSMPPKDGARCLAVIVVVMVVGVMVEVCVFGRGVRVGVCVLFPVQEKERESHQGCCTHLGNEHGFCQENPGSEQSEIGGCGENHLGPGGAELLGASDIQHNREPVAHRTDKECARYGCGVSEGLRQGYCEQHIEGACANALDTGALCGSDLIDDGGQMVIHAPAETGANHPQHTGVKAELTGKAEPAPGYHNQPGCDQHRFADMFFKQQESKQDGRYGFEIEQERAGARACRLDSFHQKYRSQYAAHKNGTQ